MCPLDPSARLVQIFYSHGCKNGKMADKSTCECVQLYGVLKETEVIVCLRFAVVLFCCSLRTSETNYLNESYAFYSAIRMRGYYSKANKEERFVFLLHLECLLVCND